MRGLAPSLHQLFDEFKVQNVDFLCVYITEAHAQDEWPISSSRFNNGKAVIYNQPRKIEERLSIARDFIQAFNFRIPMVADTMENQFEAQYSPWPLRFYIIEDGKLMFKAMPKQCTYNLGDIRNWLEERLS